MTSKFRAPRTERGEGYVWDDGEPQGPLLRPSHYRIRSSSKCESLVWKFLVETAASRRSVAIHLADGTCRNVHGMIYLIEASIYFDELNLRDRKSAHSHITISSEDRMFLKFYWLLDNANYTISFAFKIFMQRFYIKVCVLALQFPALFNNPFNLLQIINFSLAFFFY